MKGADKPRFTAERFEPLGLVGAPEEVLQRPKEIVPEALPKLGEDDGSIEALALGKKAVPLDPEEAAPPPEIMHLGLASGERGGDFVPDFRLRRRPDLESGPPRAAAKIGLFPKEKKAGLQKADGLGH